MVFFCQNNQWAISEPFERQSRIPLYQRALGFGFPGVRVDGNDVLATYAVAQAALQRARDGQGPTLVEAFTYRMGAHTTTDDPTRYRLCEDLETWKLKDPIERVRAYLTRNGLADQDFFDLVETEADALGEHLREGCRALPEPSPLDVFDHVYAEQTAELAEQKAGYAAYLDSFEVAATGRSPMSRITLAKGLNAGLRTAMEDDAKVLMMGEDVGKLGGVFRVTDGLQKDFGEDRVIDTPLAESGIIGTAVGMAMRGYRPVCEIQFDGFVYPAYDQIVSQLAKLHFRSQGKVPMPIVVRIPFGGGIGAVEHHSESPEAQFAHTPGLKVVACSNPVDGYWMIQQAIACDDPVIFLEPKRQYHAGKAELDVTVEPQPLFTSRRRARGPRPHPAGLRTDGATPAWPAPRLPSGTASASRSSTCAASRPWTWARWSPRSAGPAVRSSPTRRTSTSASAPRSRPGSPSSASTPWRRRCCGWAGSTRRTRRAGSRSSGSRIWTGSWTPSTDPSPSDRSPADR